MCCSRSCRPQPQLEYGLVGLIPRTGSRRIARWWPSSCQPSATQSGFLVRPLGFSGGTGRESEHAGRVPVRHPFRPLARPPVGCHLAGLDNNPGYVSGPFLDWFIGTPGISRSCGWPVGLRIGGKPCLVSRWRPRVANHGTKHEGRETDRKIGPMWRRGRMAPRASVLQSSRPVKAAAMPLRPAFLLVSLGLISHRATGGPIQAQCGWAGGSSWSPPAHPGRCSRIGRGKREASRRDHLVVAAEKTHGAQLTVRRGDGCRCA